MTSQTIQQKLSSMRGQLLRWIAVYGLGRWLCVGLGILAIDMAIDRVFKMDFAQRLVLLVLMIGAIGAYFIWKVVRPLMFRASDTALIYEVEQEHPELKEALLSGFQLSNQKDLASLGFSPQLAEATIRQGNETAAGLDFGDALNLGQAKWNWMLLLSSAGLAIALGLGITSNTFLKTWFNRNILLGEAQWPQQTYLEIAGVVDGKLIVSRGSDHRQFVVVSENSQVQDISVSLEVDNPAGRSILPMKPTGKSAGREHLFTFNNVSSEFRFRARGGDDTTEWIQVVLVEPPNVSSMKLTTLLPEYTGVAGESLTGSGPHSVLRGSKLEIEIETNKALSKAELMFGEESFDMVGSDQKFQLTLPTEGELRGGEYEFALLDAERVKGNRKSKFKISIAEDKPPKVRANLLGISGEVVPRAMLPTSFQVLDEHGIAKLEFVCDWKSEDVDNGSERNVSVLIAKYGEEGMLKDRNNRLSDAVAVLDLIPLKLQPGISLKMRVAATDFLPGGENVGSSQEFLLRVVTEEALRASLLRREIEQREAFDQAYQKQLALTTELEAILLRRKPEDVSDQDFLADQEAKLIATVREQKGIGTAIATVADRFEDFLVEIKNNRLDEAENEIAPDQRIETRFDAKIIQPIRQLDAERIALAARYMEDCRLNAAKPEQLTAAVARANVVHQEILVKMKEILSAMSSSENFQGIINDILQIKRDTEAIKKGVDNQKPKDGDIFKDDDIFDK